ncbi:hypothetical protein LEP1GSC131_1287 [Leptospira kirschneri str. 200802841]|uniref:Uncharacterized protein n=1 Tax=Leptospira kirschneri str. 200802841 TaxID=1193047 RepID=A0A828XXA6_9LEPT|nr:hypothetical protein LEP1GSC131_1287 [Leptospira kirschneri str. 200802841]
MRRFVFLQNKFGCGNYCILIRHIEYRVLFPVKMWELLQVAIL